MNGEAWHRTGNRSGRKRTGHLLQVIDKVKFWKQGTRRHTIPSQTEAPSAPSTPRGPRVSPGRAQTFQYRREGVARSFLRTTCCLEERRPFLSIVMAAGRRTNVTRPTERQLRVRATRRRPSRIPLVWRGTDSSIAPRRRREIPRNTALSGDIDVHRRLDSTLDSTIPLRSQPFPCPYDTG